MGQNWQTQDNLLEPSSPKITAAEWRWVITWSIGILLLSCLPYLIAIQAAPEGWTFAGILVNPLDGHSYIAKMQQGEAGSWLFHLSYTPEPHEGVFVYTFYLWLGHLAALTGLDKILVFHLARLLTGFSLALVAFQFITRIILQPEARRLAFIMMLTSAGLGWSGSLFGAFPIDLWLPEAFVPYTLYTNPHFPFALMLMLLIFNHILGSVDHDRALTSDQPPPNLAISFLNSSSPPFSSWLWTGLAALALVTTSPFGLAVVLAVAGVFLVWLYLATRRLPWPQIWLTLAVAICAAPMLLYQYWVFATNPAMVGWSVQNVTSAPRLIDFLLGYGLVGLLALVGMAWVIQANIFQAVTPSTPGKTIPVDPEAFPQRQLWNFRKGKPGEWLVLLWAVTAVALVYFPSDLQRRLIHGLHVPLCILAAIGLQRSLAESRILSNYRRLITIAVVTLGVLGTLAVWGLPLIGIAQSSEEAGIIPILFLRQEETAAFEWLRAHAGPDDIILASPRLSMMLPGQTGARVFYGHPIETLDAKNKEVQMRAFFDGELDLVSPAPDFIIYSSSERALDQPETLSDYSPVFSTGDLVIYQRLNERE